MIKLAFWAAISDDGEILVAYSADDGNNGDAARTECNQYINDALLNDRAALRLVPLYEAVAPMLASARVPDEWVRRLSAPITPEELKRAWNMIGQAHPQKEWVERALIGFIELRLAAAPKPETEE